MSFKIKSVDLVSFRSYATHGFEFGEDVNIIVGDNAVGKTNLIEALQLLTMLESFRTSRWVDVVRWGDDMGMAAMSAEDDKRLLDIKAVFKDNRRTYFQNGKQKTISDLRGLLPSVIFTPDDLRLVKDSASRRRAALDMVGVQLSSVYSSIKSDYEKVITQRNQLLKEAYVPQELLDSWTESLITIGAMFFTHRINLFDQIKTRFLDIYEAMIPDEKIDIEYLPCWNDDPIAATAENPEEALRRLGEELLAQEKAAQTTLFGPQKDSIDFTIGGMSARHFASQGQQRTLSLVWKLAEVETILQIKGVLPVLLLDDVMSELDAHRRAMLLGYIKEHRIQTFITTTSLEYFDDDLLEQATILKLGDGEHAE